jgi:GT2 family glycosyltransferase
MLEVTAGVREGSAPPLVVSIVIPTWRRATYLAQNLEGVLGQSRPADEIIVVGRDEDVAAHEVVRSQGSRVRWLGGADPGHVRPIRAGLAAVRGDIVAFLDDDVRPDQDWLERLLACFDEPNIACAGGRVVNAGFTGKVRTDAGQIRWYGRHIGNVGALETRGSIRVASVMECNWAWRTSILRSLAFDPRLDFDDGSMYGLDLCLQAKQAGYDIVYTAETRVRDAGAPRDPSLDRGDRAQRSFTYSRNYTLIALNRFKGLQRLAFIAWWWLVGERGSYGLGTAMADLVLVGPRVWPRIKRSFQGKAEGLRLWLGR